MQVEAYVIPKITSYSPNVDKKARDLEYIRTLVLADPDFVRRGQIEVLLGASAHASLIEGEVRRGSPLDPIAMSSKIGWIVSGNYGIGTTCGLSVVNDGDESCLSFNLEKFWQQEEILSSSNALLSPDEQACEEFFTKTHSRDVSGRYIVRLPFKNNTTNLTFRGSYEIAEKLFKRTELRFETDPMFASAYHKFMHGIEDAGHMERSSLVISFLFRYFMPHHGILKKTGKFRSVFNGAAKDYDKKSINDLLHCGANLLPDLAELLIGWMKYKYVFVSDIEHMFRQILIHEDDRKFQQIVWRFDKNQEIQCWSLNTVIYGMISSPYLANRVIRQLAIDEGNKYPLAVDILNRETYMDDMLSGGHSLLETVAKQQDLIKICKVDGFSLHKWMANDPSLLNFPSSELAERNSTNSCFGLLGLNWCPQQDYFSFDITIDQLKKELTKREVLSSIAKFYDPLGFIAPVIITAKVYMQKLWLAKVGWDEKIPSPLKDEFLNWYNNIPTLRSLKISRWLNFVPNAKYELYGFADASKIAYAACIYLKVTFEGKSTAHLVQAKSKVAPIKPLLTIPKLELEAAVLLTKLAVKVLKALSLDSVDIYLFTDSMDVLYWLKEHPSKWPMFVANRCSKVHTLLPEAYWNHVRTHENPADCVSRGLMPESLESFSLWWEGGEVIMRAHNFKNTFQSKSVNVLTCLHLGSEKKEKKVVETWDLVEKYSDLQKLLRITSYVLRYIDKLLKKCRINLKNRSELMNNSWYRISSELICPRNVSVSELIRARLVWVYLAQRDYFKNDIKLLKKNKPLNDANLRKLDPFFDHNLLRLGGRIHKSLLDYDQKHPLILPSDSKFSKFIVDYCHKRMLHGGVTLTLSALRQEFWVIKARNMVRSCINKCNKCIRYRANKMSQKMGILPAYRVTRPDKPFRNTGIDYAGPFSILRFRGRGSRTYKAYIAVFVCMTTKAVHLELVTGYTSENFIAAFRRFTSTRGQCSGLFSDQGTTFTGADKILKQMYEQSSDYMQELEKSLAQEGTSWTFNPPGAPHFGGIWEAAVKSVKHHLRRVIGEHNLTFEEFYTFLKQVESCLNSRPLIPLTDDPTENQFLTPSLILTQSESYILPEPDYTNDKPTPLDHFKQVQIMVQNWWKQWSKEYLQTLQERHKWQNENKNIEKDDVVLISDETMSPSKWPIGIVVRVYTAPDSLVRVADLKCQSSMLTRPIVKLVKLYISNEDNV